MILHAVVECMGITVIEEHPLVLVMLYKVMLFRLIKVSMVPSEVTVS